MHYWQRWRGFYIQKQNKKPLDITERKYGTPLAQKGKNCSIKITNTETNHNYLRYIYEERNLQTNR